MKKCILLLFLLASPLFGRIGENLEQLKARYGDVIKADTDDVKDENGKPLQRFYFEKNDLRIWAIIYKGRCHKLIFANKDYHVMDRTTARLLLSVNMNAGYEEQEANYWLGHQGITGCIACISSKDGAFGVFTVDYDILSKLHEAGKTSGM